MEDACERTCGVEGSGVVVGVRNISLVAANDAVAAGRLTSLGIQDHQQQMHESVLKRVSKKSEFVEDYMTATCVPTTL